MKWGGSTRRVPCHCCLEDWIHVYCWMKSCAISRSIIILLLAIQTSINDFIMQNKSFTVHKKALFICKHVSRDIFVTIMFSYQATAIQVHLPEEERRGSSPRISWVRVSTDLGDRNLQITHRCCCFSIQVHLQREKKKFRAYTESKQRELIMTHSASIMNKARKQWAWHVDREFFLGTYTGSKQRENWWWTNRFCIHQEESKFAASLTSWLVGHHDVDQSKDGRGYQ